jgi:hypothetical protein
MGVFYPWFGASYDLGVLCATSCLGAPRWGQFGEGGERGKCIYVVYTKGERVGEVVRVRVRVRAYARLWGFVCAFGVAEVLPFGIFGAIT